MEGESGAGGFDREIEALGGVARFSAVVRRCGFCRWEGEGGGGNA